MANPLPPLENRVREVRSARGWSQDDLARRSGLSRAGISAIETERLVPSAAAALALASALDCRVEDLFSLAKPAPTGLGWAWEPPSTACRFWLAEVGGQPRMYPVEPTPLGVLPHDGVAVGPDPGGISPSADAGSTVVMAGCDPAVGLLAAALAREAGVRLIALPRSSRAALSLLGRGLVHVAGVHLGRDDDGNAAEARAAFGPGRAFSLLRAARWEEGVACDPARRIASVGAALRSGLRWVGREVGSGARQCLDEILGDAPPPDRQARDHRGVAETIRSGWADAGVCLRLAGEEAGLDFLGVRREPYDLCFPDPLRDDRRVQALIQAVRSNAYRRLLGDLPGYDNAETGDLRRVV